MGNNHLRLSQSCMLFFLNIQLKMMETVKKNFFGYQGLGLTESLKECIL